MSNRRKLRRERDAVVAGVASASRCSDCPGRATARRRGGQWEVTVHHAADCPSFRRITPGLHLDAASSVERAASAAGVRLGYERDGDGGLVVHHGVVTGSGR